MPHLKSLSGESGHGVDAGECPLGGVNVWSEPYHPEHGNLPLDAYICAERQRAMSEQPDDQDRPCLHCMMVELIDEFFAEHPAAGGEPDTIDTDEVVTAIAKTVAELTCSRDGSIRQQIIEKLMREIMDYDAEFRRDDGISVVGSDVRH